MAEPSVTISSERGRRIREIINHPIVTRFKFFFALVFVAFLVLYLSLMLNNKNSLTNHQEENNISNNGKMLKLLDRVLQALSSIVLPMPLGVIGQAQSHSYKNDTEKT